MMCKKKPQQSAADLGHGINSVNPLLRGSQLRVPAHHHPNHIALILHDHLSNSQEYVRRTRAAHRFGGCSKESSNRSKAERLPVAQEGQHRHMETSGNNELTNLQRNPGRCQRAWPRARVTLEPYGHLPSQPETCVLQTDAR